MKESEVQEMVADYLSLVYPSVQFHSDFGLGTKLRPSQAIRQSKQNGGRRGWPDMIIAEPRAGKGALFLELKKPKTRLKKKDGSWSTPHIAEQAAVLEKLRQAGYVAEFAVGFGEAKKLIDEYLKGPK